MRTARHAERHLSYRSNWLRAAVLGANDGIVSTSSLVLGVAASGAGSSAILTAGIAGLVAGALSMAAGEFVSVSSQRDTERADLRVEARELREYPEHELEELTGIYEGRGVPRDVARGRRDRAHRARRARGPRPGRAGARGRAPGSSAAGRAGVGGLLLGWCGAARPVGGARPSGAGSWSASWSPCSGLAGLGALGARLGGADMARATARVVGWGVLAMAVTAGIGSLCRRQRGG